MLVSLRDLLNCEDYYIDDQTFQIVSFKQKKYEQGKILRPSIDNKGYIKYDFYVNGIRKTIRLHHIVVKLFIDKNFDSTKFEVDHKNRNKQDNRIENLAIVSRSENNRNKSSYKGKEFNYVNDIGEKLVINEEAGIYYSLETDQFYMYINQSGNYKELHQCFKNGKNHPCIEYRYNNKYHYLNINKFKKSLNKQ